MGLASCISSKKVSPPDGPQDLSTVGKVRSRRELERARYLRKGCLLWFAHRHAADAEESALLGCLGNVLADLTQPALKATASPGAFASTTAPALRSVSMHFALISAGLLPAGP
jgi:hypothetical protein